MACEEQPTASRKRAPHSRTTKVVDGFPKRDHNNNNNNETPDGYQIEDVNYLTPSAEELRSIDEKPDYSEWKPQIRWPDTIVQIFLHAGFVYGLFLLFSVKFYSILWCKSPPIFTFYLNNKTQWLMCLFCSFWINNVLRLWNHSWCAQAMVSQLVHRELAPPCTVDVPIYDRRPGNLWLSLYQKIKLNPNVNIYSQRDAYTWAHDHRVHHKFSETDADPHNCHRGFFFAHIGWVILTPHPEVVAKRKIIDMRDLEADPIVMFQKKWEHFLSFDS